jgi:hypothetical protein
MTTVSKHYAPNAAASELQEDRRVSIRPMSLGERQRFAAEAAGLLRAGMASAGVLAGEDAPLGELDDQIAGLGADPAPEGELLLMGVVDGVPVGRLWATLVTYPEGGGLGFRGNLVELYPEFRGQRLTPSFLGALRRHLLTLDVRDVQGRLYARDANARRTVIEEGARIDDVHLRKDLA